MKRAGPAPADAHLDYLRMELRAAEAIETALLAEARGALVRHEVMQQLGAPEEGLVRYARLAGQGSATRASAIEATRQNQATWRRLIAEHLARTAPVQTVDPIRAENADAAIFELLCQVGGRMPQEGAR